jgi:hypothetical protein
MKRSSGGEHERMKRQKTQGVEEKELRGGGQASTVSSMMLGGLKGYSAGSKIRP